MNRDEIVDGLFKLASSAEADLARVKVLINLVGAIIKTSQETEVITLLIEPGGLGEFLRSCIKNNPRARRHSDGRSTGAKS